MVISKIVYGNRITNLTRLSKKLYFHSFFNDNINNTKKTWQGINSLISNNRKVKKPITALKDPNTNKIIRDKSKLPGVINKHFASVGQKAFCLPYLLATDPAFGG